MKCKDNELTRDVEELLEQTVLEEATKAVWDAFEAALKQLDSESVHILQRHLEGVSTEVLSQERGIAQTEMEAWLEKSKREVIEGLRRNSKVRQ